MERAGYRRLYRGVPYQTFIEDAIRSRWIELKDGGGSWPCDLAGARHVFLRVPSGEPGKPGPASTPKPPGLLTAEAVLEAGGIQDLAEQVPDIAKAAVGNNLRFNVRVELGGETAPDPDSVEKINELLAEVSDKLKLG